MTGKARLPHVKRYVDRHKRERNYFRRPGQKDIALPGRYGSPEFMAAYGAALMGAATAPAGPRLKAPKKPRPGRAGSTSEAIALYLSSARFGELAESSRQIRRSFLLKWGAAAAGISLDRHTTASLVAELNGLKPNTVRARLLIFRGLFGWASTPAPAGPGLLKADPTIGIKKPKAEVNPNGWRAWTDAELAQFRAYWPLGRQPRLAFELYLAFGARGSDVVTLGWHSYRENGSRLWVQPRKTFRTRLEVSVPIVPALKAALDLLEKPEPTAGLLLHPPFLTHGGPKKIRPFSRMHLTSKMKQWCAEAGLPPDCLPHGLRGSRVTTLLEAGRLPQDIGAVTGQSVATVLRYGRNYNRARAADRALEGM